MSCESSLTISQRCVDGVRFHVVEAGTVALVECQVPGIESHLGRREVINSIVDGKKSKTLRAWKLTVATTVHESGRCDTRPVRAVLSVAFLMCPENHGRRRYDIENFVKPVVDDIAMGLWGDLESVSNDPSARFDADDSVFRSLYLEDCPVEAPDVEGVYIVVFPLDGGRRTQFGR